jgi:hypothetical protein
MDTRTPGRTRLYDLCLLWALCLGLWPFADPGHKFDTIASGIDVTVHLAAWYILWGRWKLVRR